MSRRFVDYSVFHQFRKAKFAYSGSILSLRQFLLLTKWPLKNANYEGGQNWLEKNNLAIRILIGETSVSSSFLSIKTPHPTHFC